MSRPKLQIQWEPLDWYLEILGLGAAIFLIAYPLYYYGQLPEEIPNHFNGKGQVNGYGHKSSIWLLPAIALGTYLFIWFLNRTPHLFNYTKKITEENAYRQYQLATRLLRIYNVIIAVFFAYLTYAMVKTGIEGGQQINQTIFLLFIAVLILLPIGYLLINRKES